MNDLFKLLHIRPDLPARTVLKHLAYEPGPNALNHVTRKTLIACTSRSGSTLVQESLGRYGMNFEEYFNVRLAPKQAVELGLAKTTRDYGNFLARTAVANDHFGVKGTYVAFVFLWYLNEFPQLRSSWRFIHLRRRNVIRQAISMSIVAVTDQWNSERLARKSVGAQDYSFDDIMARVETVLNESQTLERCFTLLGIEPYRLFYEDFVADIPGQTEMIAKFLDVDVARFPAARLHVPRLKVQATEINDAWEARFRADLAARLGGAPQAPATG